MIQLLKEKLKRVEYIMKMILIALLKLKSVKKRGSKLYLMKLTKKKRPLFSALFRNTPLRLEI